KSKKKVSKTQQTKNRDKGEKNHSQLSQGPSEPLTNGKKVNKKEKSGHVALYSHETSDGSAIAENEQISDDISKMILRFQLDAAQQSILVMEKELQSEQQTIQNLKTV